MKKKRKKWTLEQQSKFLIQLSQLLEKGYTLSHALEFLQFQLPHNLREQIHHSLLQLKSGDSLHSVFSTLHFHKDVLSYLYFAEQHGDIYFALREGGKMLHQKVKNMKQFQKLIQYPIVLLFFMMAILFMLSTILLPQFQTLYQSLGHKQSSWLMFFMKGLSLFPYMLPLFVLFLLISYLIFKRLRTSLSPIQQVNFLLKVPVVKKIVLLFNSYFFAIHISNLLKGGLSIYDCLQLFEKQYHYAFFKGEASYLMQQLSAGLQLDDIIRGRTYYDDEMANIITHGQLNGNLSQELYDYSSFMIERIEAIIHKSLHFVQPLLFSLIGLVILLMYLGVMVPMFDAMSSL
ncbi:competence type IV pilus assembly protein ComGB [Metabacillus iocasae]|uniref:Competence protein ComGB n=1 Tax=Priestia iocasae TaxID=2291674 RepID=A0ABS2QQ15_9BACI|nr:competence type IV pilus assembly protein ComGB [Metabacillus iocasae]MBM7701546.1 competence protein ComGB [Metabacillus iocasae]